VRLRLLLLTGLVGGLLAVVPQTASAAECDPWDRPEQGVSGDVPVEDQLSGESRQGYRCNIRPLANDDLDGKGGDIQLTWAWDCAFIPASKSGAPAETVHVFDMTDPAHPLETAKLYRSNWAGKGGSLLGIHEGIHANEAAGILVVPIGYSISVYRITPACAATHLSDFNFSYDPTGDPNHDPQYGGAGIHSGQLSPDGTLYYATDIGNGGPQSAPDGPCATVIDLADPAAPYVYARVGRDFPCHDLEVSPDGNTIYAGYYSAGVGYAAAVGAAFTPVNQPAYALTGVRMIDVSQIAARTGTEAPVVTEITGGRQHTEVYFRQGESEYLLGAEEAVCPGGNGRIVEIGEDQDGRPKLSPVSEIELGVNQLENCSASADNLNPDLLYQMTHYMSVDDPHNASLAFYTWYGSGLRVFDIRNVNNPVEVAYFNPAVGEGSESYSDWSSSYPRYDKETGIIWFGSRANGLNVVELDPGLRPRYKGVKVSRRWRAPVPTGAPVIAGAAARSLPADPGPGYGFCTLAIP
jgi:hypothetical protein